MFRYLRKNAPTRWLAIVSMVMLASALAVWGHWQWREAPVANNFKDFDRLIWKYQSESMGVERRPKLDSFPTEEIRSVEYVTIFQDCQALSLQGQAYENFKSTPTLSDFISAEMSSKYGPQTRSAYRIYGTDWTVSGLQAVANQDGTATVTLTIRRAGEWQDDPNVDVE